MRWAVWGDSLWYADSLAAKARHGYAAFCRQVACQLACNRTRGQRKMQQHDTWHENGATRHAAWQPWHQHAIMPGCWYAVEFVYFQDYIGADYGLVDCATGVPLPDFYTALVWTRTMGTTVLDVTATAKMTILPSENSSVRVYAHCTAPSESPAVPQGAVTVLVINLSNHSTTVHFGASGVQARQYVLSPGTASGSITGLGGLLGTVAQLNGKLLLLQSDGTVPPIEPEAVVTTVVPATSVAFFVLPSAKHPRC